MVQVGAGTGSESTPAKPGQHDAVIAETVDLGVEDHPKYGRRHRAMTIILLDEWNEYEDDNGQVHRYRKEVKFYFDVARGLGSWRHKDGTKLRKLIEGIFGKRFTPEQIRAYVPREKGGEGKTLDMAKLDGKPLQVVTEIATSQQGHEYTKFNMALPAGENKIAVPDDYKTWAQREADREEREANGNGGGGDTSFDYGANATDEAAADEGIPFFDL